MSCMEVTQALVRLAKAGHFDFGQETAVVAVQHMLWQTVDLFRAFADLGLKPQNIFALGKIYSNSPPVIRALRELGVTVPNSTMPQPGRFNESFERDIKHLWEVAATTLTRRRIKRIIVLDDGGKCITNTPPNLMRKFAIGGVEQTSLGMFLFEKSPPPFAVTSWARAAVKLRIGGLIFARCLIDKLNSEFLRGKSLRGERLGIIGLGSIGAATAGRAVLQGNEVLFYDPNPYLQIPRHLQDRISRVDSLEELLLNSDYVIGCSGRDPFADSWPVRHRPGTKMFSSSGDDQEFRPIIRDLVRKPSFKVTSDTWDIRSDDGPSGSLMIAYYGYPYNFVSRQAEAVPTHIVQLETGGLLAGMIQARTHLALYEAGYEKNSGIHRVSPEAQRFVYEAWLSAMKNQNIDVVERYGYDPVMSGAAKRMKWFLDNTEPHPAGSYEPRPNVENVMREIVGPSPWSFKYSAPLGVDLDRETRSNLRSL